MEKLDVKDNVIYIGKSDLISKNMVGVIRLIINDVATVSFGHFVIKCKLKDLKLYIPEEQPKEEIIFTLDDFKAIKSKILDSDYLKKRVPNFDISERGMLLASGEVILSFFKEELFNSGKSL